MDSVSGLLGNPDTVDGVVVEVLKVYSFFTYQAEEVANFLEHLAAEMLERVEPDLDEEAIKQVQRCVAELPKDPLANDVRLAGLRGWSPARSCQRFEPMLVKPLQRNPGIRAGVESAQVFGDEFFQCLLRAEFGHFGFWSQDALPIAP